MRRFDRFLNNRANRRIICTGTVVLLLAAAGSYVLGGMMARYGMQREIARLIQIFGDRAASAGIRTDMNVRTLPEYAQMHRFYTLICFAASGGCTLLVTLVNYLHTDRIYRDLELLAEDCRHLAGDLSHQPVMRGSPAGSVRRVSEGIARVAQRTYHIADALQKQQHIHKNLLSDVSHQLKTSLAVIRLNRDMLQLLPLESDDRQRLSDEIALHLDGMEQLVLEALKFAKINAKAIQYERSEQNLTATCKLAAERLAAYSQERGTAVLVAAEADICFPHDRVWLCEAIENLLKNAIDHAGCTAVTLSLTVMPSAVRFSVRDNGRGIPLEELPYLFERFRSGAADAVPHSTGLGMPIAQQVFRAHGAELTVYSDSSGTEMLSFFRA